MNNENILKNNREFNLAKTLESFIQLIQNIEKTKNEIDYRRYAFIFVFICSMPLSYFIFKGAAPSKTIEQFLIFFSLIYSFFTVLFLQLFSFLSNKLKTITASQLKDIVSKLIYNLVDDASDFKFNISTTDKENIFKVVITNKTAIETVINLNNSPQIFIKEITEAIKESEN